MHLNDRMGELEKNAEFLLNLHPGIIKELVSSNIEQAKKEAEKDFVIEHSCPNRDILGKQKNKGNHNHLKC